MRPAWVDRGVMALGLLLVLAPWVRAEETEERPKEWAQPIELKGVPNLHKVSDSLYRSAQPTAVGMEKLNELGIKTVVNLRAMHSDKDEIGELGLASETIPMNTWHVEEEDAVKFLKIATDPDRAPVLVHCQHGADRTGTMCAIYRIAIQGWTKEEAVREMTEGGFGFHTVWKNLAPWIEKVDVAKLRKEAGLAEPAADNSEPKAEPAGARS